MKESDMFSPVKELLLHKIGCHSVYGEVAGYDVVGLLNQVEVIVEMKKQLNFKVIEQAIRAVGVSDYVFIAIPTPKTSVNRIAERFLKQEGIGLIYVGTESAYIKSWGKRHGKVRSSIRNYVLTHHKETVGGVKSGDGPTEYSITIERIKAFLSRKDWVAVDEIVQNVETHYASPKASVGATLKAVWNQDWCEYKTEGRKTYFRLIK